MVDYLVIGAGYGGLSTAALLAKEGKNVLLLESHTKIGGCASFYKRKEFTFDVGATTLSGVLPHQPLGQLFDMLDIQPDLLKIDPGVIVKIGNEEIERISNKELWGERAAKIFSSANQTKFWNEVFETNETVWDFIENNSALPPNTFSDYLKLGKLSNMKYAKLLPLAFRSVGSIKEKFGLSNNLFDRFLREQLLITTQNTVEDSPFLTAALGLAYPSETYYPVGGMYKPAQLILDSLLSNGGTIQLKTKVEQITREKDYYLIKTNKSEIIKAKHVISSIPIWNMARITDGKIQKYFQGISKQNSFAWGAFTINFAINSDYDLNSLYYQIHTDRLIPNCDAQSFFVSFSEKNDRQKAPKGWRTVTISVHTNVNKWYNLAGEDYKKQKEETVAFILSNFDAHFPQLSQSEKLYILSGSPNTFEHYTNRHKGFVGGIPHSVQKSLLRMPANITPYSGLYMVGDTVFPGQGTPAVVLGAINVVKRIMN